MDRTAFEYLYLHANALAELGFVRATVALANAPMPEPTAEQAAANAEFVERLMNPDAENFNWAAFDGVEFPDWFAEPADAAPETPAVDLGPFFEEAMESLGGAYDFESMPELESYVQRLYAAGPLLEMRITAHHDTAEPALEAALMALDTGPAPLHGPLTPAQLLVWLERYEAHDEAVRLVVQLVRSRDPLLGGALSLQ